MKITPDSRLIRSLAAQSGLTHQRALCEWIDNAFDAGAMVVSITFGKRGGHSFVEVEDDGCGAPDVTAFAKLGDSNRHASTRSGTYGIGSKDAALWYGGEKSVLDVTSERAGVRRGLAIDWGHMAKHDWEIDDPRDLTALGRSGVTLSVEPLAREPPHGQAWRSLVEALGYIYSQALRKGRQIKLRARKAPFDLVTPWSPPKMMAESIIETTVTVDGKQARVWAGMVADGETAPRYPGITYHHGFRVIKEASKDGCGDAPINRLVGSVEIGDDWRRTKNKDDIIHGEQLYAAVESALKPLLDRAEKIGMALENEAFTHAISQHVNAAIKAPEKDAKAVREKGDRKGTVEPKGTGAKHKQASREQKGSTFSGGRSGGYLRITWARLEDESAGRIVGNTIELNETNALVSQIKAAANTEAAAVLALSIVSADRCLTGGKPQLSLHGFGPEARFADVMGGLMAKSSKLDGRALHVVKGAA